MHLFASHPATLPPIALCPIFTKMLALFKPKSTKYQFLTTIFTILFASVANLS